MIQIPKHINDLIAYKPGKADQNLFGDQNLSKTAVLSSNENNFGPSPIAIQYIQQAFKQIHLYPDPTANELRSNVARHIDRPINEILFSNGSDSLLSHILTAFLEPGDELLTSEGVFLAIYVMANKHNKKCVSVPMMDNRAFDLDRIIHAITKKTKVIYLCNPNNPTGGIITENKLADFINRVPQDILIVVDEAYFEYACFMDESYPDSTTYKKPNVLTLRTFSKAYGLAGLRLGYAVGDEKIISVLSKVRLTFEPNSIAQAAGIGALRDNNHIDKVVLNNQNGLQLFYQAFEKLGIKYYESFGNFVMIEFPKKKVAHELFTKLYQEGVLVRKLDAFRFPNAIRISTGRPEENQLFLEKLQDVYVA